jgi:hypothetical protein
VDLLTRAGARGIGLLLIPIAAWGGIVAFVGPSFNYEIAGTHDSWVWNRSHALLHFAPGLAGVIGGLLMLSAVPWALERLGALLALTAGVWFVIGPTLEPLWGAHGVSTAALDGPSGSTTLRVLEGIGYHYGTGAVMVILAGFALGLLALAPKTVAATAPTTQTEADRGRRPIFRHARHA